MAGSESREWIVIVGSFLFLCSLDVPLSDRNHGEDSKFVKYNDKSWYKNLLGEIMYAETSNNNEVRVPGDSQEQDSDLNVQNNVVNIESSKVEEDVEIVSVSDELLAPPSHQKDSNLHVHPRANPVLFFAAKIPLSVF